ncbi:unnamed protein product [Ambrosiozyma monospora]|uniref:Unnamed protein product n=1 Tax=Ambrosiozyma monospora TaxID=43982 RepID=A0ACB5TCH5_AMBMO|nr:unnamed protein product [Ambrosiozyma monospora]
MEYSVPHLDMQVIDTQGYIDKTKGLYGLIRKPLRPSIQSQIHKMEKQAVVTLENPFSRARFTVGHFFYLNSRGVTFFKYRTNMYGKPSILRNLKTSLKNNRRMINPNFKEHLIAPFRGRVDFVLDKLGYVELDNDDGFYGGEYWKVQIPKTLRSVIRSPSIADYIEFGLGSDKFLKTFHYTRLVEVQTHLNTKTLLDDAIRSSDMDTTI